MRSKYLVPAHERLSVDGSIDGSIVSGPSDI
jgi:hypothetical protein